MIKFNAFSSRSTLDTALADKVAELLKTAIQRKGKASIAVSGGSTPKAFFQALSKKVIDWHKVTVTLADERWVDTESDASNTRLVQKNLLINNASRAQFFNLKQAEALSDSILSTLNTQVTATLLPLDVLILGMGEDGHTASLFPCSNQINQALMQPNSAALIKVTPQSAPHDRISFTFDALSKSHSTILHICGTNKKKIFEKALNSATAIDMPIKAFLQHPDINTQVYWAK